MSKTEQIKALLKSVAGNPLTAPVGFTALSTGIGMYSGQDMPQAITEAIPAVAGSYAVQNVFERGLPNWKTPAFKIGKKTISPIHYGGVIGSIIGGGVGSELGSIAYKQFDPEGYKDVEINPFLYSIDEATLPASQVLKAFF